MGLSERRAPLCRLIGNRPRHHPLVYIELSPEPKLDGVCNVGRRKPSEPSIRQTIGPVKHQVWQRNSQNIDLLPSRLLGPSVHCGPLIGPRISEVVPTASDVGVSASRKPGAKRL